MERGRTAPIVVHAPTFMEGRAMSLQGRVVGVAHGVQDVILLARRHGVELEADELDRTPLVEWRGGGAAHESMRWGVVSPG